MAASAKRKVCDSAADIIFVMLQQESTVYCCSDYLVKGAISPRNEKCDGEAMMEGLDRQMAMQTPQEKGDNQCLDDSEAFRRKMVRNREKICGWLYDVVDQCDLSREIVAVAMSYLDRFIASIIMVVMSSTNAVNGYVYQLTALTAFYLSVKLHDHRPIRLERLVQLSSGRFSEEDVRAAELSMLQALKWRMHPQTAIAFVHEFLKFFFLPRRQHSDAGSEGEEEEECNRKENDDDEEARKGVIGSILDLASFYTELSVKEYDLCVALSRPSIIAYAAILNAMERIDVAYLDFSARCTFLERISSMCPDLNPFSASVSYAQQRLIDLYNQSRPDSHCFGPYMTEVAVMTTTPRFSLTSPVCVSGIDGQAAVEHQGHGHDCSVISEMTPTIRRAKRDKQNRMQMNGSRLF